MAALPQVQAKSGQMYDADSPQGKMIAQSRQRASAAAASKQPFSSGSSALGGEGIKPIFENISSQLTSIGENVTAIVDIQQADTRGDALNSANVPQDDLIPEGPDDDGIYREDAGGGGAGGGGFFSKLFGGAGGILAGAGALVGGFGALLAGGGVLLKEFNNFDGEKFKKNIESIMSIVPSITSPGAAAAFAVDTGLFLITMTQIGLGLAAFGIGQGVAGIGQKFLDFDAQGIYDNVEILLSITSLFGKGLGALAEGGKFFIAMTAIGAGLAVFGAGAAVAATGDAIGQGIDAVTKEGWAQSIVDNVSTLLGINNLFTGTLDALAEGGTFFVAMTAIGAGLAVFGAGSAVGAATDAIGQGVTKISEKGWAQSIVDNVTTLLSINDLFDGFGDVLKKNGTFLIAMTAITAGLAVFSFGSAVAGATTGALDVTDWATRGEGMTWSQSIVDHVTTLLSIASLPNVGADTSDFAGVMSGISLGLIAFGVGSFFAAGADGLSNFISSAEEGEGSWADKIKDKVTTLLSIINPEEGGATVRDATNFSLIMGKLSAGLMKFSGGEFVSSLLSVGSSVLNFLKGEDSPVQEMLNIAESADDLEKGANAIESLTNSLSRISALAFDGSKLKMKKFATDLAESVPVIEMAIMGGTLNKGFLNLKKNITFKGLASDDVDFATAINNIGALRYVLSADIQALNTSGGATQQLQNLSTEQMTSNGPVIINNIADNSTTSTRGGDAIVSDMAIDQADLQTMFLLQQGAVSAITR
jgi:hypothetical protein